MPWINKKLGVYNKKKSKNYTIRQEEATAGNIGKGTKPSKRIPQKEYKKPILNRSLGYLTKVWQIKTLRPFGPILKR